MRPDARCISAAACRSGWRQPGSSGQLQPGWWGPDPEIPHSHSPDSRFGRGRESPFPDSAGKRDSQGTEPPMESGMGMIPDPRQIGDGGGDGPPIPALRPFGTTLLYHTGITRISPSVLRLSVSSFRMRLKLEIRIVLHGRRCPDGAGGYVSPSHTCAGVNSPVAAAVPAAV